MIGCHKANNGRPIDATVTKYFSYKPGTYWIYKDSLSGALDSFVVVKNTFTTIPDNLGGYEEETEFISIFNNGNNIGNGEWSLFESVVEYHNTLVYSEDYSFLFGFPFSSTGTTDSIFSDVISVVNYFPTYSLMGIAYNAVTEVSHYGLHDSYFDIFYINQDSGIIKMAYHHPVDSTNYILELQSCNIIH